MVTIRMRARACQQRAASVVSLAAVLLFVAGPKDLLSQETVIAERCFLRIKQEVAVPAKDRGVLSQVLAGPGRIVEASQLLASLESSEAKLILDAAKIELETAETARKLSVEVEIAEANLDESRAALEQALVDADIASQEAESTTAVEIAETALKLAFEEHRRAVAARERFSSSVSEFEVMRLDTATREKSLQVEHSRHNQSVAKLKSQSQTAAVVQSRKAVGRLELEVKAAQHGQTLADLDITRLSKAVELAQEKLDRKSITAPIPGLIIEQIREEGEWGRSGRPDPAHCQARHFTRRRLRRGFCSFSALCWPIR